jgi:hypothetical protein
MDRNVDCKVHAEVSATETKSPCWSCRRPDGTSKFLDFNKCQSVIECRTLFYQTNVVSNTLYRLDLVKLDNDSQHREFTDLAFGYVVEMNLYLFQRWKKLCLSFNLKDRKCLRIFDAKLSIGGNYTCSKLFGRPRPRGPVVLLCKDRGPSVAQLYFFGIPKEGKPPPIC